MNSFSIANQYKAEARELANKEARAPLPLWKKAILGVNALAIADLVLTNKVDHYVLSMLMIGTGVYLTLTALRREIGARLAIWNTTNGIPEKQRLYIILASGLMAIPVSLAAAKILSCTGYKSFHALAVSAWTTLLVTTIFNQLVGLVYLNRRTARI